uniref:Secreted protein n=1 Tax=Arundo donax TaxID=35708 RepID=A0A0A9CGV2_ARUDO
MIKVSSLFLFFSIFLSRFVSVHLGACHVRAKCTNDSGTGFLVGNNFHRSTIRQLQVPIPTVLAVPAVSNH